MKGLFQKKSKMKGHFLITIRFGVLEMHTQLINIRNLKYQFKESLLHTYISHSLKQ